eukprot:jgi/Chlat1/2883/Chrsp2S08901
MASTASDNDKAIVPLRRSARGKRRVDYDESEAQEEEAQQPGQRPRRQGQQNQQQQQQQRPQPPQLTDRCWEPPCTPNSFCNAVLIPWEITRDFNTDVVERVCAASPVDAEKTSGVVQYISHVSDILDGALGVEKGNAPERAQTVLFRMQHDGQIWKIIDHRARTIAMGIAQVLKVKEAFSIVEDLAGATVVMFTGMAERAHAAAYSFAIATNAYYAAQQSYDRQKDLRDFVEVGKVKLYFSSADYSERWTQALLQGLGVVLNAGIGMWGDKRIPCLPGIVVPPV